MRHAAAGFMGLATAKHARLVAVERARLAVAFDVRPRRLEIAEGRFARREVQMHQPAGRIVDVHQQCAGRRPFLEPPVIAAIDLDQFAQTRTTRPRLVDLRRALPAWYPQTGVPHQPSSPFLSHPDPLPLPHLPPRPPPPTIPLA